MKCPKCGREMSEIWRGRDSYDPIETNEFYCRFCDLQSGTEEYEKYTRGIVK